METFTVEEFQKNFDTLMNRVEHGESFVITSKYGNVAIVPYKETIKVIENSIVDEEIVRIHTNHEEGC